jgi:uncharacterized protein YndB with AHSA1/START domain
MTEKETTYSEIPPVVKSIQIQRSLEDTFRIFTEKAGEWWPLASHSVGGEQAETCILESRVGGRFYEVLKDGTEAIWGTVLVWDPPHRLVLTWHPGREASTAQQLEVSFSADGPGTRVDLVHRGWEHLGDLALGTRQNYESGWNEVLERYVALANQAASV